MSSHSQSSAENLAMVRERMEVAASRSGRRVDDITIIAVSKTHTSSLIQAMYEAGVRHFGENRVQEWESKQSHLAGLDATWHMIGHLQSNKAARAVQLFDCVDSVDSVSLAERLDRAKGESNENNSASIGEKPGVKEMNSRLSVLIEVKLDPGETKSGVSEEELLRLAEAVMRLPNLELRGLMGVPPFFDDPEKARPYFNRLRELRDSIRARMGRELLPALSMGMSHDFEVAIEEGATEIRVGTALFGSRPKA